VFLSIKIDVNNSNRKRTQSCRNEFAFNWSSCPVSRRCR